MPANANYSATSSNTAFHLVIKVRLSPITCRGLPSLVVGPPGPFRPSPSFFSASNIIHGRTFPLASPMRPALGTYVWAWFELPAPCR